MLKKNKRQRDKVKERDGKAETTLLVYDTIYDTNKKKCKKIQCDKFFKLTRPIEKNCKLTRPHWKKIVNLLGPLEENFL